MNPIFDAQFYGYLKTALGVPGVVIPVFKAGGMLCIQDTGRNGLISRFVEIEMTDSDVVIPTSNTASLSVGDQPVYAIAFDEQNIISGTKEQLSTELNFEDPRLIDQAELRADLAEFVEAEDALQRAVRDIEHKNAAYTGNVVKNQSTSIQKKRQFGDASSRSGKKCRSRTPKTSNREEKSEAVATTDAPSASEWVHRSDVKSAVCAELKRHIFSKYVKNRLRQGRVILTALAEPEPSDSQKVKAVMTGEHGTKVYVLKVTKADLQCVVLYPVRRSGSRKKLRGKFNFGFRQKIPVNQRPRVRYATK